MAACASSSLATRASAQNATLSAQGLPFRWGIEDTADGKVMVMRMLPLPVGSTRADAQMTEEILVAIRRREQSKGRLNAELEEVRQMNDGREVWILQSPFEGIAYVVSVGSPDQGVSRIGVLGPYTYSP
jgi:hypothetical protein